MNTAMRKTVLLDICCNPEGTVSSTNVSLSSTFIHYQICTQLLPAQAGEYSVYVKLMSVQLIDHWWCKRVYLDYVAVESFRITVALTEAAASLLSLGSCVFQPDESYSPSTMFNKKKRNWLILSHQVLHKPVLSVFYLGRLVL